MTSKGDGAAAGPDADEGEDQLTARLTTAGRGSRIQSLERAADILSYFRVNRPHLSLQEITARSGLTRATAHRYVSVLRDLDLLRFDPTTSSYSLGTRILTLASAAAAGHPMVRIVGPYMEELVRSTNETAVLTVWDGTAPVVLRVDDNSDRVVRVIVQNGVRLPPWDSAHGKVFCAFLPDDEVPRRPATGAKRSAIQRDIDQIRRTRMSVNTNVGEGTRAIASPVFSHADLVGSIGIIGTAASVPDGCDSPVAQAVLSAANRLSAELGDVSFGT